MNEDTQKLWGSVRSEIHRGRFVAASHLISYAVGEDIRDAMVAYYRSYRDLIPSAVTEDELSTYQVLGPISTLDLMLNTGIRWEYAQKGQELVERIEAEMAGSEWELFARYRHTLVVYPQCISTKAYEALGSHASTLSHLIKTICLLSPTPEQIEDMRVWFPDARIIVESGYLDGRMPVPRAR